MRKPKLIATSVVRGSQQGESHGGVYLIDFENQVVEQHVDWNTGEIDFAGRGADRGLRGITFDAGDIYIAASDELFCYDQNFRIKRSWRNPFLKHCHEICRRDRKIFLTSTGFDSLLVFDIDLAAFMWGIHIQRDTQGDWHGNIFDPSSSVGPGPGNRSHINSTFIDEDGIYVSGLHTGALLYINSDNEVREFCSLPSGTHNARPFRDGVLFNDTANNHVRFVTPDRALAMPILVYPENELSFRGVDNSKVARQGFGRGLTLLSEDLVAVGSSPSTVSLYELRSGRCVDAVNISMDIRNAIHGLEVWPYEG